MTSAEVSYENWIGSTMVLEVVAGEVPELRSVAKTVGCETYMVRILQVNVTHDSEMKAALLLSEQSIVKALFFKLLAIPNSRGEATTVPARARVKKERNKTIASGRLGYEYKL